KRHDSAESAESDEKNAGEVVLLFPDFPSSRLGGVFGDMNDDDSNPLAGSGFWDPFYPRLQEVINQFRAQMAAAFAGMKPGSLMPGSLSPWGSSGQLPEGANSTSTTKVINNHRVTINETTYSDGDEDSKTFVKVRVVHVNPIEESSESGESNVSASTPLEANQAEGEREPLTSTAAPSRSVETLEEFDNEIPKSQVEVLNA
ncbi:hypothetical protein QAD02_003964, partial [Eretmocerus hayati]